MSGDVLTDIFGVPIPLVRTFNWIYDATAGSSKTFTVPASPVFGWSVDSVYVSYHCSAVIGNRTLHISVYDAAAHLIFDVSWGINQPANQTYPYVAFPGSVSQQAVAPFSVSFPSMYLPTGYQFRVWDSSAIDAAGDTLTVAISRGSY